MTTPTFRNPPRHVLSHYVDAARVSLSDCFCPCGQGHRGFKNPRLFKDRPTDGKCSGMRSPFLNSCVCNSVGNCSYPLLRFATRHGVVLRIMLLRQRSSTLCTPRRFKPAQPCTHRHRSAYILAAHAAPSAGRHLSRRGAPPCFLPPACI